MNYYEIVTGLAVEHTMEETDAPSPLLPPTWSEYQRCCELMVACHALTQEEEEYLERLRGAPFEAISLSDILEVSSGVEPPFHLYSLPLCTAVERQGLTSEMHFLPVRVFYKGDRLPYMAVRYAPTLYVPCLRPLTIYRSMGEKETYEFFGIHLEFDWTRCGHKVYQRHGALLVLKKEQIAGRVLFRVLNERDAPLVVREDIIEQWWEWGVEDFDLQEVIVE